MYIIACIKIDLMPEKKMFGQHNINVTSSCDLVNIWDKTIFLLA